MNQQLNVNHLQAETEICRRSTQSDCPDVLAEIYKDHINISIWQRTLSPELMRAADFILGLNHAFRFSGSIEPETAFDSLCEALGSTSEAKIISTDVAEIVNMFCFLFDLEQVGLRLTALDRAMCPKFHVDRVPCRLVSTYSETATEWLNHQDVDRNKLGVGSKGKPDEESGLYRSPSDIHQLHCGDVALLKGESWIGNEGGGLVHRSPTLSNQRKRLLLTLDF